MWRLFSQSQSEYFVSCSVATIYSLPLYAKIYGRKVGLVYLVSFRFVKERIKKIYVHTAIKIFFCNQISRNKALRNDNCVFSLVFRWFKFTLKPPYSITHDKLRLAIWDTSFWTFWSNLDTRDLETYPRTYSGNF